MGFRLKRRCRSCPADALKRIDQSGARDLEGAARGGFAGAVFQRGDNLFQLFGVNGGWTAARRPRRLAAAKPAMTRSRVKARSYCARAPKTENRSSPCGVVVSICSVRERNATPFFFRSAMIDSRLGSDRPSLSSFQTTRQSPARKSRRQALRPGRSSRARWPCRREDGARRRPPRSGRRVAGHWTAGRRSRRRAYIRRGRPLENISVRGWKPEGPKPPAGSVHDSPARTKARGCPFVDATRALHCAYFL